MSDEFLVLKPTDWVAVGALIYRMATEKGFTIPDTPEGRKTLLEQNGVALDSRVTDVQFLRSTPEIMYVVIPPKELIQAAKESVDGVHSYVLPEEYVDYVEGNAGALDHRSMFFFRVGDYSLNHCK